MLATGRGSVLLSSLAQHYQDRFIGFAWVALSYLRGGSRELFEFEGSLAALKERVGSEVFGYQAFFNQADAHTKCEQHVSPPFRRALPPHAIGKSSDG